MVEPTKIQHKSHWPVPLAGVILLVVGVLATWWQFSPRDSVRYLTQKASRGSVVRTISASGTVNPVITVQVGTYVSGVVQARYCDYNTEVKKDQLCAKIDPRPYETVVAQNRATLSVAKAQLTKDTASLAYAKANFERNQELVRRQAVSQDAFDNSRSAYDQAQAQITYDLANIELREAELKGVEVNLDYTNIRSPVDGTVVSRNVEVGQTVAASFQTPTLFLIATDLTNMQVDTNVSESDVGSLEVGDKASFTVESFAKRRFDGAVIQIRQAPQTIQNVVTYDAVISAPNADLSLKPGMTATVSLVTDRRDNVLRVPDQALRFAPADALPETGSTGSARIYVLRDGQPRLLAVEIGLDDDVYSEVLKGDLQVGDEVIIGEQGGTTSTVPATRPSSLRAPRL